MNIRPNLAVIALAMTVVVGAAIALFLAHKFAQSESDRDSLVWQRQMAVVINSRQTAIEEWLDGEKKIITRLAENPNLRIYVGNIEEASGDLNDENSMAQASYLENMMKSVAQQNGYMHEVSRDFTVNANIQNAKIAGLALTDQQGKIIVSTASMPSVIRSIALYLERGANSDVISYGPYKGEQGEPTLSFVAPIFGVQDDNSSPAIGFVVGIKVVPDEVYQKLIQPGEISKTAKNYLVRKNETSVEYLSPLRNENGDLNQPLTIVLDGKNESLAAVFALENAQETTGGFAERINYDGKKVLVTGRKIKDTNWVLLRTVDSQEVLNAIVARKNAIMWISGLSILAISILIILIWRHGISVRVARAAELQKILMQRYEKLSHFLQIVTDSQPTAITAIDDHGCYSFANAQAIKGTGLDSKDLVGKKIGSVSLTLKSPNTEKYCLDVLKNEKALSFVEKFADSGMTIKSDYIPLSVDHEKGVLMVAEDISPIVRERERRETALKNLVSTLTMVIDSRDPYSARHSERVAMVSFAIAQEMNMDDVTCDTANIAGALMNLGKILVPRELLTRPKGLSEDELTAIRSSIMKSADMLETVDFDGPVVKTLRQVRAHWDGSGTPEGLAGQDILVSARIVAVANAFVGMSSARAHRAGMDMIKAASLLLNDADHIYDRKPVTALLNYLENKDGLDKWKEFGVPVILAIDDDGESLPHTEG
ncbi:MAG: PAS domain S-box protein [Emcibacter sp.]|nr:PAS domain S-box protein [Emcibacter sp.]